MLGRIGSVMMFWRTGRLAWGLMRDRRVPLSTKAVVPGALLYALFPIDLIPDFFPALGQIDDLTVLLGSLLLFVRLCPKEVVQEHLMGIAGKRRQETPEPSGKVIDGDYEVLK